MPLLLAAGWRIEVHGWRKVKLHRGGRAMRWACRVVDMAVEAHNPSKIVSGTNLE